MGKILKEGDLLCLFGELGSGKTVFTKGIAEGLGIPEKNVISPSFVLIREHTCGRIPLYHFDLYRVKNINEIFCLGYEEYFYDQGVCVVEWAQNLKKLLPENHLAVKFSVTGRNRRLIEFFAYGRRYVKLLEKIR